MVIAEEPNLSVSSWKSCLKSYGVNVLFWLFVPYRWSNKNKFLPFLINFFFNKNFDIMDLETEISNKEIETKWKNFDLWRNEYNFLSRFPVIRICCASHHQNKRITWFIYIYKPCITTENELLLLRMRELFNFNIVFRWISARI